MTLQFKDHKKDIPEWRFLVYVHPSGRNDVQDWYDRLAPAERAKFRVARLEYLAQWPVERWELPYFRRLHGPCAGLGEIRTKIDRVQVRLLGFFGPRQREFTVVLRTTEKGGKFEDRDACGKAQTRRRSIDERPELAHEWNY